MGVTHPHLGPIWYRSEPSNVPSSPKQFLGWDFFAISYDKTALALHWIITDSFTILFQITVSPDSRNTAWVSFDGRKRQELEHGDR